MSPTTILAALITTALLCLGCFNYGKHVEHNACEAAKVKPLEKAIEKHNAVAAVVAPIEQATVAATAKTAAIFNGINKELIKHAQNNPIDGDCRVDDDSMRLWRAANANRDAATFGSGYAGMPGDDTRPCQRQDTRPRIESRLGDEDLSRMQGSAQRPGAVVGQAGVGE